MDERALQHLDNAIEASARLTHALQTLRERERVRTANKKASGSGDDEPDPLAVSVDKAKMPTAEEPEGATQNVIWLYE